MTPLGTLDLPVKRGEPAETRIPGYEQSRHIAARIGLPADEVGGYDLAFALDGEPQHSHRTTISVVLRERN